jgi:hypothetical protein
LLNPRSALVPPLAPSDAARCKNRYKHELAKRLALDQALISLIFCWLVALPL